MNILFLPTYMYMIQIGKSLICTHVYKHFLPLSKWQVGLNPTLKGICRKTKQVNTKSISFSYPHEHLYFPFNKLTDTLYPACGYTMSYSPSYLQIPLVVCLNVQLDSAYQSLQLLLFAIKNTKTIKPTYWCMVQKSYMHCNKKCDFIT